MIREGKRTVLIDASFQFENKASNRCHVDGCAHNYVARRHRVQLYKIPRDPNIARRWLDACGYENIQVSPSSSTFKVCREHFTQNDFEGPTTLRPDAVPSLFTTFSRSLMNKQNVNDPNASSSSSSLTPTPSAKRFRPDMASIRAKQSTPVTNTVNNKRGSLPYRSSNNSSNNNNTNNNTNQSYQRQHLSSLANHHYNNEQQQQQMLSPSPTRESFDESNKQTTHDTKLVTDIELNMNCMDEQLSDVQLSHCPVKVRTTVFQSIIHTHSMFHL